MGGAKSITPHLNKLSKEGILFSQFYASGHRSNRGIGSLFSSYPGLPYDAIIENPFKSEKLPHLIKSIKAQDYHTAFYYGCEIDFANFRAYFNQGGVDKIVSKLDFDFSSNNTKWGIHDDIVFDTLFNDLKALSEFFISNGHPINHIDVGGGLAIDYDFKESFSPELMTKKVIDLAGNIPIFFEPGRSLIGQAGSLVTEVLGIKINCKNRFLIVDSGMIDLIRPALYQANHKIEAISASSESPEKHYVVGPVCETADSFGEFSISAKEHDHLIIYSVGAYGYSMASNYNSRLRAAEYLVDGSKITEIRKAESYEDLIKLEQY